MIKHLDQVTEYPLCWPETKQRTADRIDIPMTKVRHAATLARGVREIGRQLAMWGVYRDYYTLSMAPAFRRQTGDPGVALWWSDPTARGPDKLPILRVLACDQYTTQEQNLWALGK